LVCRGFRGSAVDPNAIGTRCLWTIMMLIFLTALLLLTIILVAMFSKFEDEW
jgi:hypothetical protein